MRQVLPVVALVTATGISTSKGNLVSCILFPQRMRFKYDEELPVVIALLGVYATVAFAIALHFQA